MVFLFIYHASALVRLILARAARLRFSTYKLILFLLFLFSAFRFEVGCDWTGYLAQYEVQRGAGWEAALLHREPLWWLVIELTHRAGLLYPWLNVISSAVFFFGVHILARRQPDPLGFLILLFPVLIINMPMSGIRQGAAVGLICIALTAFIDRRLIRFIFWVTIASGFHSSAAVFLLLAPLVWGSLTKGRVALSVLLAAPIAFLLLTSGDADVAFSRYVDAGRDASGAVYRTGLLLLSGIFFLVVLRTKWRERFPLDHKLASLGALMMISTFPMVGLSTVIADRIGYYFVPIQAMIFSRVPYIHGGSLGRLLTAAPYIGLAVFFVTWTATSRVFDQCYLPYRTWLFGIPEGTAYLF